MKVTFHGHSFAAIEANGMNILIDPFVTGNPQTDLKVEDVKADVIVVTHGHDDHVGDTIEIAKRNNALVIASFELITQLRWWGAENTQNVCPGGKHEVNGVTFKLTAALHSGGGFIKEEEKRLIYCGQPHGVLVSYGGKTVYHAGDTGLFGDMKLIGEMQDIDLALLPIGDHFTMGPEDAIVAAKMLKAKKVVPIHYNTIPILNQNAQAFVDALEPSVGVILNSGEEIAI